MTMPPSLRKFALTTHLTVSVGWIGAVVAFLALAVKAQTTSDPTVLRGAWQAMDVVGGWVIVPLAISSLVTGLVMSLGTRWGLFRHYWVLISLVMTTLATLVLLSNMQTVRSYAGLAADPTTTEATLRTGLRGEFLHAGVGLVVLLVIQALNIYKPRAMTAYGRRKQATQRGQRRQPSPDRSDTSISRS